MRFSIIFLVVAEIGLPVPTYPQIWYTKSFKDIVDRHLWTKVHDCYTLIKHLGWMPCNINVICTSLTGTFNGLQFRCWQYRSIFVRLAIVGSQICEIPHSTDYRENSTSACLKVPGCALCHSWCLLTTSLPDVQYTSTLMIPRCLKSSNQNHLTLICMLFY